MITEHLYEIHDWLLCRGWRLSEDGFWYHDELPDRCRSPYAAYYCQLNAYDEPSFLPKPRT